MQIGPLRAAKGTQNMPQKLNPGELFPNLNLSLLDGGSFNMPEDLGGSMTLALFYRGHW